MVVSYIMDWVICYHNFKIYIDGQIVQDLTSRIFLKLAPMTMNISSNFRTCLLTQDVLFSFSRFLLVKVVFRNQGQDIRCVHRAPVVCMWREGCYPVCFLWKGRP